MTSRTRTPSSVRRRVVIVPIPAPIGSLIGQPGWSGLAASRKRRSEVVEDLLAAGLAAGEEGSDA